MSSRIGTNQIKNLVSRRKGKEDCHLKPEIQLTLKCPDSCLHESERKLKKTYNEVLRNIIEGNKFKVQKLNSSSPHTILRFL